jgi:hypothetical protein
VSPFGNSIGLFSVLHYPFMPVHGARRGGKREPAYLGRGPLGR